MNHSIAILRKISYERLNCSCTFPQACCVHWPCERDDVTWDKRTKCFFWISAKDEIVLTSEVWENRPHNYAIWVIVTYPQLSPRRSPSLGVCNHPIFLSRRFHRSIYFYFEFVSNSGAHRNLSDQLQSQARTNVDISTWCRHVRWSCIVSSLPKRARVDWNWPISWEKYWYPI